MVVMHEMQGKFGGGSGGSPMYFLLDVNSWRGSSGSPNAIFH
jgi:hypothetical protein